MKSFALVVTHS